MKKPIQIIKQEADDSLLTENFITLFSKVFSLVDTSCETVLVHEDFPRITEDDIDEFSRFCMGSKKVVVSGCKATVHPYRLIFENEEGFCRPLVNIPQSIRGNRHLYPDVVQIVPALLFVPTGTRQDELTGELIPDIYMMDDKKLLDKTRFPDSLYLSESLRKGY